MPDSGSSECAAGINARVQRGMRDTRAERDKGRGRPRKTSTVGENGGSDMRHYKGAAIQTSEGVRKRHKHSLGSNERHMPLHPRVPES